MNKCALAKAKSWVEGMTSGFVAEVECCANAYTQWLVALVHST